MHEFTIGLEYFIIGVAIGFFGAPIYQFTRMAWWQIKYIWNNWSVK
jgi:hypothetical protein